MMKTSHNGTDYLWPVIFPDKMVHKDVFLALQMGTMIIGDGLPSIASAGTIATLDVVGVGGASETLRCQSAGAKDQFIINNYNYSHGIEAPDG